MPWTVEQVLPGQTAALRQQVLRPGGALPLEGDNDPTALHVAAYDAADHLVACGNIRPGAAPDGIPPGQPGTVWRLRGMATAEGARGRGAGAAVLAALLDLAGRHGGQLLWCNARTPAQSFYERAGFRAAGEGWVDPEIGPHVLMWTALSGVGQA